MKLGLASEPSPVERQQKISISQPGARGFLAQMPQGLSIIIKVKGCLRIVTGVEELLPQRQGSGDVVAHAERSDNKQQDVQTDCALALHGNVIRSREHLVHSVSRFYASAAN